jgi:hypothetical protein
MGNYSYLRKIINGEKCNIIWDRANQEILLKYWILRQAYNSDNRPTTLAELAKYFNDTKFIGYFDDDIDNIAALKELCRILEPSDGIPEIWFTFDANDSQYGFKFNSDNGTIDIYYSEFICDSKPWNEEIFSMINNSKIQLCTL